MLLSRAPRPPLSAFVSLLWYGDAWRPLHAARERHMPDGSCGLIVPLDGRPGAIVSGPRCESFVLRTAQAPATIIGAQFTHGGAAAFLDVPLSEVRNTHAPLADVCRDEVHSLQLALLELPTPLARLDFLERWLATRMLHRAGPERAIAWAICQLRRPQARVADVSAQIGRSSRWFIQRFARDVGLTPKVFSRVQRFQAALRAMHGRESVNLADVAAASGYFDQAHLAHEFAELAGMSPSALLAGRTQFINHVADPE